MDFKKMSPEEIKNLSYEEKKEFVRKLINSEAADIHAAFFNAATKEAVDIKGLVERIGEEEALDIIIKALDKQINTISLDEDDVVNLVEKSMRGECTEEEQALLDVIMKDMNQNNHIQFEHYWLEETLNLIYHAQTKVKYNPKLLDLLSACTVLFYLSGISSNNGALSKYTPDNIGMVSEICNQIGNDIYDTWKASCTSMPEPELIICSLLHLARDIANKNNIEFANAKTIANLLGITFEDDDDIENGSNKTSDCNICQPATYNPTDEDREMRDLLKD